MTVAEITRKPAGRGGASPARLPALEASRPPRSLYLHFPFCRHRCHYCDFSVKRAREAPIADWIRCVESELARWFASAGWDPPLHLDTIFIGGGTPSLLGGDGMARVARLLEAWFSFEGDVEWTVEANPASFNGEIADAWRAMGVNRVSLGIQSLDDRVLRWLGRLHDVNGALRALRDATEAGFSRVSADLMFGLPATVIRSWPEEIERVVSSGVGHVSAYGLTVEPRTPLYRWIELGRIPSPDPERYTEEYLQLASILGRAGFRHYEVSNFAREGEECLHNWQYWIGAAYLGLGPSAHSFLPPLRLWNVFRWDAYRGTIRVGDAATAGWERVTGEQRELERLWLSLRTRSGLPDHDPVWTRKAVGPLRERWIRAGWLTRRKGRTVATAEGWLRLDDLVAGLSSSSEDRG